MCCNDIPTAGIHYLILHFNKYSYELFISLFPIINRSFMSILFNLIEYYLWIIIITLIVLLNYLKQIIIKNIYNEVDG